MRMNEIVIREVRVEEVPAVVELIREVLAEFDLTFGEGSETDAQVLALPGSYRDVGGRFWVAEDAGGAIVGTCGVFPLGDGTYELRKMYLDPRARGQRLGQRLLDEALAWTTAEGGARVVLDTTHQMTRAIAFYEANGFVRDDAFIRGSRCHRGYRRDLTRR